MLETMIKNSHKVEILKPEHICPYLPYGLEGIYKNKVTIIHGIGVDPFGENTLVSIFKEKRTKNTIEKKGDRINLYDGDSLMIKPILRPIAIIEDGIFTHQNKPIYPISDLLHDWMLLGNTQKDLGDFYGYLESFNTADVLPYWIYEKLVMWQFDVFGLIDSGLAIDITTIKEKS